MWAAVASIGALYALVAIGRSLASWNASTDVIALLALLGALVVGENLAGAVIAVMLASGRTLESWAIGRSRRDLQALVERSPTMARRYRGESLDVVDLDVVMPGDLLMIPSGEVVPVDGTVSGVSAVLDESSLTGEPLPVERQVGEAVRSGVVNAGPPMDIRATTTSSDSTYAGVIRLVREAEAHPAQFVRLADRYALWFMAVTTGAAAGAWISGGLSRAVAVLVVATPCPLILAAPIAFVAGLSRAARRGIIVKGAAVIERLSRCTTLLIDKTGTLTSGRPVVEQVVSAGDLSETELLAAAASVDQVSPHVLAAAVVRAAIERGCHLALPTEVEEVAGQGIRGMVGGQKIAVGKGTWVGVRGNPPWAKTARRRARLDGAMTIFVGVDGQPVGVLILTDPIRPDSAATIGSLRREGITRVVMATGDRVEAADAIGAVIGVDEVAAERSPAEKLDLVRVERSRAPTIMAGDGLNDAPALAIADVGVAMGARGASASSEAADIVLTVDQLDRIGEAMRMARRTVLIAKQSVFLGMAMSCVAMVFAGLGALPAVWGAMLQEGIDVAVIVNSLRALLVRHRHDELPRATLDMVQKLRGEHTELGGVLETVRSVADSLGSLRSEDVMERVRDVYSLLRETLVPHEIEDETTLYPALHPLVPKEATAPLSRAHAEILHQMKRLGRLIEDIGPETPDYSDISDLRRSLYGLYAVTRLHNAQEDESVLSLLGSSTDQSF